MRPEAHAPRSAAMYQYARQWFASGVLRDGRVFAIGGEYSTDPASTSDAWSGETFDPQTNTWTPISKPAAFEFVRGDCNGSVLADGRVLIGGASVTEPPSTWSNLTAIWDPAHDSWVQAGLEFGAVAATTKEDPFEEETFNLLPDGSILVPAVRDAPKAQRYLPWLDQWVDCAPCPVTLPVGSINGTLEEETGPTVLLPRRQGVRHRRLGPDRALHAAAGLEPDRPWVMDERAVFPGRHECEPELAHADGPGRPSVPASARPGRLHGRYDGSGRPGVLPGEPGPAGVRSRQRRDDAAAA